jgi:hypothetical protein
VELTTASGDLDDASQGNLAKLRGHAQQMIEQRSKDLDAVIAKL